MKPLCEREEIVARSPSAGSVGLSSPSIIALQSGRLIVSLDEYTSSRTEPLEYRAKIFTSDDRGIHWTLRHAFRGMHGRLFTCGGAIYYIGHDKDIVITRSVDNGHVWSECVRLTNGQHWHQTAANVWYARGNVYLVMERRTSGRAGTWPVCWLAPVLMAAAESADLLDPAVWRYASELPFVDALPSIKDNQLPGDYFGIPFFAQDFPLPNHVGNGRLMHPVGWLESQVVQILDPTHYWYDPTGLTFHLFMRANTGGTGYAAVLKVVEDLNGQLTTVMETVPSGKRLLFTPFPGGHLRFHIVYDAATTTYWLVGNQPTDSMARVETLPDRRYNLPNNERHRLVLHFSRNMIDWCFAGLIAASTSPGETRNYASAAIDGDDLVVASRSGDGEAAIRDTNLITFHRVRGFRSLIY